MKSWRKIILMTARVQRHIFGCVSRFRPIHHSADNLYQVSLSRSYTLSNKYLLFYRYFSVILSLSRFNLREEIPHVSVHAKKSQDIRA